jgi:hypothetical protein
MSADDQTPIAVSQDQITVHISSERDPYLFVGHASFAADAPRIFVAAPQKPITLSFTADRDYSNGRRWSQLPPGRYRIRVYINSGKSLTFDYQWLGQTYSDDYVLDLQ